MARLILSFFCLFLAACAAQVPPPPCPPIMADRYTASITRFNESGQDLTDIVIKADILSATGKCRYDADNNRILAAINVVFEAERGPAATEPVIDLPYFVAIPSFFPKKEGKTAFSTSFDFPVGVDMIRVRDEDVLLSIPLSEGQTRLIPDIYVGFQLREEELEYNRTNNQMY